MNYRHLFHAGNFADVLKHAVFAWIVAYLQRKPNPLRIIESHAGAGRYDLASEQASRTGEWREGVARLAEPLDEAAETLLAPYRAALAACGWTGRPGGLVYPGSPLLSQRLLREGDRYVGAELHAETFEALRLAIGQDRRCKLLAIDGWHALRANVPPVERRGLVLIDPAFEGSDEWEVASREMINAWRKWPTGCLMLWYPLKNPRQADDLADALAAAGVAERLRVDIHVDDLATADRLAGCGLQVVNPPWGLDAAVEAGLPGLAARLARSGTARYRCDLSSRDRASPP